MSSRLRCGAVSTRYLSANSTGDEDRGAFRYGLRNEDRLGS